MKKRSCSATLSARMPTSCTSTRLAGNTVESIETSSLHLDLISDLKRINSHICSIAYPILEEAGVLARTRLKEVASVANASRRRSDPAKPGKVRLAEAQTARRLTSRPPPRLPCPFPTSASCSPQGRPRVRRRARDPARARAADGRARRGRRRHDRAHRRRTPHDLGHLLNDQGETPTLRGVDDLHQFAALPFLRPIFRRRCSQPIQLHVDAKRYLCATRPVLRGAVRGFQAQPRVAGRHLPAGAGGRSSRSRMPGTPSGSDGGTTWPRSPAQATPPLAHFIAALEAAQTHAPAQS